MKKKKIVSAVTAVLALCMAMAPSAWAEEKGMDIITDTALPETSESESEKEAGDVSINSSTFPDPIFMAYVSENFDTDKNNILSSSEISYVTNIYLIDDNPFEEKDEASKIKTLEGIEYFTNLSKLNCYDNAITSLDLSKNTALTELSCSNNKLTQLSLGNNTELTTLYCGGNSLTKLDLSKNKKLNTLWCESNKLSQLSLSNNTELTTLYCNDNSLTKLDMTANTKLTDLDCHTNQITELKLPNSIEDLYCYDNKLKTLDLSNCTDLVRLLCGQESLTSLTVTNNTKLKELDVSNSGLKNLNVANNTNLEILSTCYTGITSLDVSNCTSLKQLNCSYNENLTSLKLSNSLTYLDCTVNKLKSLDLSGLTKLTNLYCQYNQIAELDTSNNTALTYLDCRKNQLTTLKVSGSVKNLSCSENKLKSLDVSGCTAMTDLSCSYNEITSLKISNSIKMLFCSNNKLKSLDVSSLSELDYLDCDKNELTSLKLNKKVETLYCFNNKLTSLDLSGCTALLYLECSNNTYSIAAVDSKISLSELPEKFDPAKASNWKGAVYDKKTNTLNYIKSEYITYDYNCGNSYTIPFELHVTNIDDIDLVADFVERLYVKLLGRAADANGKADHVSDLRSGKSACEVIKKFVFSKELKNKNLSNEEFVTRMYRAMFNREPDAKGLASYTTALDNGCSYGYVFQKMSNSSEFAKLCTSYGITKGTYKSSENRDRNPNLTAYVSRMYTVALGRQYDVTGLNTHTGNYLSGRRTAKDIARSFLFCTEFKNKNKNITDAQFLDYLYRSLFDREPDAGGKSHWLAKMNAGMTREEVFNGFTSSREFKNLVAKFGI